jgi:hypothetical protein
MKLEIELLTASRIPPRCSLLVSYPHIFPRGFIPFRNTILFAPRLTK